MKICGKKLIAGAAALAMTCSMVGVFADEAPAASGNAVTITKVEVLNDGGTVAQEYQSTNTGISLTTEQLMRVTAVLKNGTGESATPTAGEISFLSNIKNSDGSEVTLNNGTIQYVDQQTYNAGENDAVIITFRPRTSIGETGKGTFIAKAGGTNVATAATFDYTVVAPKKNMTVDPTSKEITQGDENVSFILTPDSSLEIKTVRVTENNTEISGCTFAGNTLTIPTASLAVGTHPFVISADGYNPISVTVSVKAKQQEITEEDKPGVSTGIENALEPAPKQDETDKSFAFKEKVTVNNTDYTIEYSVPTEESGKVTINGNKLTLKDGVFAAKVQLTAKVGVVSETKPVYLIPKDVTVSYGNLELISNADGSDAFDPSKVTTQDAFMNVVNSNQNSILAARTEALNIALKEGAYANNPIALDAIDFNYDNKVVLAEYRIFKLMLEGTNEIHTFKNVTDARKNYSKNN